MGQTIDFGSNAFGEWIESLQPPKTQVYLCHDATLLSRRAELMEQIEAAEQEERLSGRQSEADASSVKRLNAELDNVMEKITESSDKLMVKSPSADEMVTIAKLMKDDSEEWALRTIAFAIGQSRDDTQAFRRKVPHGTWEYLWAQVYAKAVMVNLGVPFSLDSSETTQGSSRASAPLESGG